MLRLAALVFIVLASLPVSTDAQSAGCADCDAWEWAQSADDQQQSVLAERWQNGQWELCCGFDAGSSVGTGA